MSRILALLKSEPIVIFSIITGISSVLSEQHVIPVWISLTILATITPIERQLVTPGSKLRKLGSAVRRELEI